MERLPHEMLGGLVSARDGQDCALVSGHIWPRGTARWHFAGQAVIIETCDDSWVASMVSRPDSGQTMDMAAETERLRSASGPFDIAFIDAMIPHHQSAIEAGRLALQQSNRPEIKDLALSIIEAQQREIGQMQAWRLSWGNGSTQPPADPRPGMGGHEVPGEDMNH